MNKLKRIGEEKYIRPDETFQDRLSKDEIEERLEDYKKVNIKDVQIGTHLRYFTIGEDGKKKFRLGGALIRNEGLPDYVVLSNNNIMWSVQTANTIFFAKMNFKELKAEYEDILADREETIKAMALEIKKLKTEINKLKNKYEK